MNLKQLVEERDEARREYCILAARVGSTTPAHIAKQRGWDVFNPDWQAAQRTYEQVYGGDH